LGVEIEMGNRSSAQAIYKRTSEHDCLALLVACVETRLRDEYTDRQNWVARYVVLQFNDYVLTSGE